MTAIRIVIARLRALFRHDATAGRDSRGAAVPRADADRRVRAPGSRHAGGAPGRVAAFRQPSRSSRTAATTCAAAACWRRCPGREVRAASATAGSRRSPSGRPDAGPGHRRLTALFSVIDAALLRPLPYPHPEELVTLRVEETSQDGTRATRPRWPTSARGERSRPSSRMPAWGASAGSSRSSSRPASRSG